MKRTKDEGRRVEKAAKEILAEILAKNEKGEDVVIKDKIIKGDLDLSKLNLTEENGKKLLGSSIQIKNCKIQRLAILKNIEFLKEINFEDTNFNGGANFYGSNFYGPASFRKAKFHKYTTFEKSHFAIGPNFTEAYFFDEVFFDNVRFAEKKINDIIDFYNATFIEDVYFDNAKFFESTRFSNANFKAVAYFRNSEFYKSLDMNSTKFARVDIRWNSIKDLINDEFYNDGATYLLLIENFNKLGYTEDADECYYEYRKAKMNENGRPYWSKLIDYLAWLSCGYGVRPSFTIACISGTIIIFGLLFWDINRINVTNLITTLLKIDALILAFVLSHFSKFDNQEPNLSSIFSYIYHNLLNNCNSFLENLYLSIMIFIGQTPSGFEPAGYLKFATIAEGILGYFFLGLFIVVLARKFIR